MEDIDIVVPWVDYTDAVWQKDKAKYSGEIVETINQEKYFRDWNTLKYLFRSIEQNMPWIRKIHFLTYGKLPDWLNRNHPKLQIDCHRDFFLPDSAYPVFSSCAIEMNLTGIKDLSEKFIYLNDDELILKPVSPTRFFVDDLPVDSLVQDIPRGGYLYKKIRVNDTYADICKNSINLLNPLYPLSELKRVKPEAFFHESYSWVDKLRNYIFNLYGKYCWIIPNHGPQPLLKSTISECEKKFETAIKETAQSRFRQYTNVSVYLFRYYSLVTGNFYPHSNYDSHCFVLSSYKRYLKEIKSIGKYSIICLNDSPFLTHSEYLRIKPLLEDLMENFFSRKSSFEI